MNGAANIVLKDVHVYAQNNEKPILKDIHLEISRGDWVSIVGRNGSGKSTLAKLLSGILAPARGDIHRGFAGDEPIPYVMQQEEQLFGETPWEDVVFILESRGEESWRIPAIASQALQQVGLEPLMHKPLAELSGGQRQLAAAAGCLAAKPQLLLFDEATSMLDAGSRRQVLEAAKSLHRSGSTVLWITHHMEEAAEGSRIVALDQGSIAFDGSAAAFFYEDSTGLTPCEQAGFTEPYPIQVARILMRGGMRFTHPPLTAEQLSKAMKSS